MDLFLVRHSRPTDVAGICYGRTEVDAPFTTEDLNRLTAQLPEPISKVFSSPLKRAVEVANCLGSEVFIDDRLSELDFGSWEGRPWNEIGPELLDNWIASGYAAIHSGESIGDLDARTSSWLKDLEEQVAQSVIALTHAGTIRSILRNACQIELEESLKFQVGFLTPIHLHFDLQEWRLLEP